MNIKIKHVFSKFYSISIIKHSNIEVHKKTFYVYITQNPLTPKVTIKKLTQYFLISPLNYFHVYIFMYYA